MEISFVAAMSENRVIGNKGKLPWHLPRDLKHFKELTLRKHILMGRKTFDSIKQALPKRHNLVLTHDLGFSAHDIDVVHSKEDVLKRNFSALIVVGGEEIFRLFLPECQKIYLTIVHTVTAGDTYFPEIPDFIIKSCEFHPSDERHAYSYSFIEYVRAHQL